MYNQNESSRYSTATRPYLRSDTIFRGREAHELGDLRLLLRRIGGGHLEAIQFGVKSDQLEIEMKMC